MDDSSLAVGSTQLVAAVIRQAIDDASIFQYPKRHYDRFRRCRYREDSINFLFNDPNRLKRFLNQFGLEVDLADLRLRAKIEIRRRAGTDWDKHARDDPPDPNFEQP